jgi:hypothetical protein
MALNLRERFGLKAAAPTVSLTADFRFVPAEHASLREHKVVHEEVDVLEKPLAVDRVLLLSQGSDSLQLELALCLDGPAAAAELLFNRLEAFQREPQSDAVRDLAALAPGVGEPAVAWSWGQEDRNGVAGFVRHNVMALLQGRFDTLPAQAREIDAALARTPAGAGGTGAVEQASFEPATLRVPSGGRLELGLPLRQGERHFFIASGGAVNRDPQDSQRHYFRAGLAKGPARITVLRVGSGLLPSRQILHITIE